MVKLKPSDPFPFGAYKGTKCKDVHVGYLVWLATRRDLWEPRPEVEQYLRDRGVLVTKETP